MMRTTIFFSPSATGKTANIKKLKQVDSTVVHLDCDDVVEGYIRKGRRVGALLEIKPQDWFHLSMMAGLKEHLNSLISELKKQTPHIVLDYTCEAEPLVRQAILLSVAKGRSINLVGITANPEIVLSRLLERQSEGKNLPAALPSYLKERHEILPKWLSTFKSFPRQFQAIAQMVDTATLHNNDGVAFCDVAIWKDGNATIVDQTLYDQFLQLEDVEPHAASFEARLVGSRRGSGGGNRYIFETAPSRFFGAKRPLVNAEAASTTDLSM